MLVFDQYIYIWEKNMRKLLVLLFAVSFAVCNANAIEVSEFQTEVKKIEKEEDQINYLENIKIEVLSSKNEESIITYYRDLHWLYYENSIADKAVATADILIDIFEKQNNLKMQAKYLIYKAEDYILINEDYETAKLFVQEALSIAQDINNTDLIILAKANLAAIESAIGYYFKALETLSDAEMLVNEDTDYKIKEELYAEFTSVFSYMKNFEKNKEYTQKIINLYKNKKIEKGYNYVATIYNYSSLLNNRTEKIKLMKNIEEIIENNSISTKATLYEIMARLDVYEDKSLSYIDKSINIFESFKNVYEIFLSKRTKIQLLLKRFKNEEAIKIINSLSEKERNRSDILKLHSEAYENMGESEKSLELAMKYQEVYEEGFNKVFVKTVKDLRNMFQTVEKEKENTRLLKETREKQEKIRDEQLKLNKKEKLILLSYLVLIVILVLCIVSVLAYRRIKIKATIDELTKVYNRKTIQKIAEKIFKNNRSKPLSIIFFDIDFFKKINDNFGHQAGDLVLQTISTTVKKTLRRDDKVGRYGGEEFLIVSRNGIGITEKMAERLRKEIIKLKFEQYPEIRVTASFGIANRLSDDQKVQDIIKRADEKLYEAKESGRNIVVK
jgi:diguanylate cyclase (GGDEF)-like protein